MTEQRATLVSQAINSGRAVLFTLAAANLYAPTDFGRIAVVVLATVLATAVLRALVTNPLAVLSPERREFLVPAVQTQLVAAALVAFVAASVLAFVEGSATVWVGIGLAPAVLAFDAARVASIHLGESTRAVVLDLTWLVLLMLAVVGVWLAGASSTVLIALWAATSLVALVAVVPSVLGFDPTVSRLFREQHLGLGARMGFEVMLEAIPTRLVPLIWLPWISIDATGAYRAVETLLGAAVLVWSARSLSTLREASVLHRQSSNQGVLARVARRMSAVGLLVVANWLVIALVGSEIGPRLFDDVWEGAESLVLAVAVFILAQVAMSVATITARAIQRQQWANTIAGAAAVMALVPLLVSGRRWDVERVLMVDAVAIGLAAIGGVVWLATRGGEEGEELPTRFG